MRQGWLVAVREMRERSRSSGFRTGLIVMLLVVVAAIAVPAMIDTSGGTRDVGLSGSTPAGLPQTAREQGDAVGVAVRIHKYENVAAGREAVRQDDVDVLVVNGRRLEWQGRTDEQLKAVLTGAIQLVAVHRRAVAAGIDPNDLLALVRPVPVKNVEIGPTAGRGPDDGTAAILMTGLLLLAITTYGNLVLTGVVEEKTSRVVEVLLARMPARSLLAGKVTGIGLLGFGQFVVTAVAALVATLMVDSVDIPAISGGVLAWVVVWFVLGYAVYAMAYGAVGSLASRAEDAQSAAGPVVYVLLGAYIASFIAVDNDPEGGWARLLSLFPLTAPLAMPGRIALGAAAWWEPFVAAAIATIAGLVVIAGRIYTNAILQTGPTLRLRDAWHSEPERASATSATSSDRPTNGRTGGFIGQRGPTDEQRHGDNAHSYDDATDRAVAGPPGTPTGSETRR
jgi:ABC-2 type transport system permease protein